MEYVDSMGRRADDANRAAWRVRAPKWEGVVVAEGPELNARVITAPAFLHWAVGRPVGRVSDYCIAKGYRFERTV